MEKAKMNQWLAEWYAQNSGKVAALMQDIWSHPEVSLQEFYCCKATAEFARQQGFTRIEQHRAEDWNNADAEPNCMIASWGSGRPIIAIVGELDALPSLGQACCPEQSPIPGPGHGCGHNLMSGGAAGAAAALRYAMEKDGLAGTVRLIEAPAEEIGVGKAYLAKNGVFSDVDMTLMWHPMDGNLDVSPVPQQVAFRAEFRFYGKSTHAAGDVWNGRSALDAQQLMNLGCEFLHEHMPPNTWLHYNITNGGAAPNIVPNFASSLYMVRSMDNYAEAEALFARVVKVAEGAAHMTETKMEYTVLSVMPQYFYNLPLCRHISEAAEKVPPLAYTPEEYELARVHYTAVQGKNPPEDSVLLPTGVIPFNVERKGGANCTDAADMTYFSPSMHIQGLGKVTDCPGHSWSTTFVSGSSLGVKAGIYAYQVLAQAAYDAFADPSIVAECWEAYKAMNIPEHKNWV